MRLWRHTACLQLLTTGGGSIVAVLMRLRKGGTWLSDEQKAKLIFDYIENPSYRAVGRKNGVSASTVKRVIDENTVIKEVLKSLWGRSPQSVSLYLREKQEMIYGIINKCLGILNDDEKLRSATLPQIASAMATLLEKFVVASEDSQEPENDPLSLGLMELGEALGRCGAGLKDGDEAD